MSIGLETRWFPPEDRPELWIPRCFRSGLWDTGENGHGMHRFLEIQTKKKQRERRVQWCENVQLITIIGGWTNLFEKYFLVKLDHFPNFRDENKKYLSCHHPDNHIQMGSMYGILYLQNWIKCRYIYRPMDPIGYAIQSYAIKLCGQIQMFHVYLDFPERLTWNLQITQLCSMLIFRGVDFPEIFEDFPFLKDTQIVGCGFWDPCFRYQIQPQELRQSNR